MNIGTFNKTAVSLGLGHIERAILAIVDVEDEYEQSYAAEDLAIDIFRPEKPYPEDWWPPRPSKLRSYAPRIRWRVNFRSGLR